MIKPAAANVFFFFLSFSSRPVWLIDSVTSAAPGSAHTPNNGPPSEAPPVHRCESRLQFSSRKSGRPSGNRRYVFRIALETRRSKICTTLFVDQSTVHACRTNIYDNSVKMLRIALLLPSLLL